MSSRSSRQHCVALCREHPWPRALKAIPARSVKLAVPGSTRATRICFIDYDQNTEQAIWITEHLRANYPDMHVFAVSAYSDPERIIAAMRVGCIEYLLKPILTERVLDGLARVETKQKERSRSKVHGKVITLIGAKGGTGVTSLSLHLALELADAKTKCLLVDHHAALGDASLYLGTGRHQYSFYELANNTDRLDQELLQGFLLRHSSGLHLLDSPEAADLFTRLRLRPWNTHCSF